MEWLKELRLNDKRTSAEIAASAGITRAAYSNIESGARRPSPEVAKRIANTLGFAWTRFFDDTDESA